MSWAEIHALSGLLFPSPEKDPEPNYNTAPTHYCPVVLSDGSNIWGEYAFWGFIPPWFDKDLSDKKFNTINARIEDVTQKATYRGSIQRHRCLVPASCFYEWQTAGRAEGEKGKKQAYAIGVAGKDDGVSSFMMAGVWSHWVGTLKAERFEAYTFALLTREAGPKMGEIHHREPAILIDDEISTWLNAPLDEALPKLTVPLPSQLLRFHRVSDRVGSVRNNDADLMRPVDDRPQQGSLF